MKRLIYLLVAVSCLLFNGSLLAAEKPATPAADKEAGESQRAQALLARAVDYYKGNKDRALPAFMRAGEFINGDLYVYVLGTDGKMLASGGSSSALVGRDISNMRDAAGKAFCQVVGLQVGQPVHRGLIRRPRRVFR